MDTITNKFNSLVNILKQAQSTRKDIAIEIHYGKLCVNVMVRYNREFLAEGIFKVSELNGRLEASLLNFGNERYQEQWDIVSDEFSAVKAANAFGDFVSESKEVKGNCDKYDEMIDKFRSTIRNVAGVLTTEQLSDLSSVCNYFVARK